ncbi:2-acylglycerol O-acyltransferase 3-like [Ochotona curzoniae]|uniref:2-acylglycerol O-acyltransferase 3-like n=1 Tax=Ochotona curzoniae TaxID=130825 RepID=UPI001B353C06|nr:2-acylglycerol O-acyltransferase 3-like [Ochotona curzoniae]
MVEGAAGMDDSVGPPASHPRKTLLKQWLEDLSAFHHVLLLCSAPCSIFLLISLFFTRLWFLSVLYLTWLYLDRNTPSQGGRRLDCLRSWSMWKHQRDYFPIKLVKTAELPPDKKYLLVTHPHGIMSYGLLCNFVSESNNFSQHFPGIKLWIAMMSLFFYVPGFREYVMSQGLRPVSRPSLDFILSQPQLGLAVAIVPGGAHEAMYAAPGQNCLKLENRKGFVRLALSHGASLVPVYSFGENDIFKCLTFAKGSWQYQIQIICKKLTRIAPCIFWGRSLFLPNSWGLLPLPRPITTVVGAPIHVPQLSTPTEEQVDHYHRLYLEALERLFEEHKESCGISASTHLTYC